MKTSKMFMSNNACTMAKDRINMPIALTDVQRLKKLQNVSGGISAII